MSDRGGHGDAIRLTGPSGVALVIGDGVQPFRDGYDFVDFPVSIVAAGLSARTLVRSAEGASPTSLHRFLRELADDWKGTQPDRSWEAVEHGLSIDAHREPLGHVLLTFSLRESLPARCVAGQGDGTARRRGRNGDPCERGRKAPWQVAHHSCRTTHGRRYGQGSCSRAAGIRGHAEVRSRSVRGVHRRWGYCGAAGERTAGSPAAASPVALRRATVEHRP